MSCISGCGYCMGSDMGHTVGCCGGSVCRMASIQVRQAPETVLRDWTPTVETETRYVIKDRNGDVMTLTQKEFAIVHLGLPGYQKPTKAAKQAVSKEVPVQSEVT